MSFPAITFKHTNTPVVYHLQEIVTQKFESLTHHVKGDTTARCEVEFQKVAPHNNGPVYRVEVNLLSNGVVYRAENTAESFEKAIDSVRGEIDRELQRAKTKKQSMFRRGARRMKDMMRFSNN